MCPTIARSLSGRLLPLVSDERTSAKCDACPFCNDVCIHDDCGACSAKQRLLSEKKGRSSFTVCQVKRHNTKDDAWLHACGQVYDITRLITLDLHPAGNDCLIKKAGTDATVDFEFHPCSARKFWAKFRIGTLARCPAHSPRPWYMFW